MFDRRRFSPFIPAGKRLPSPSPLERGRGGEAHSNWHKGRLPYPLTHCQLS